jgi:hypothetical protein
LNVRGWARQLRDHEVQGLSTIANKEGISVARVSQLLVLDRLPRAEVEPLLRSMKRISVRAAIRAERKI